MGQTAVTKRAQRGSNASEKRICIVCRICGIGIFVVNSHVTCHIQIQVIAPDTKGVYEKIERSGNNA